MECWRAQLFSLNWPVLVWSYRYLMHAIQSPNETDLPWFSQLVHWEWPSVLTGTHSLWLWPYLTSDCWVSVGLSRHMGTGVVNDRKHWTGALQFLVRHVLEDKSDSKVFSWFILVQTGLWKSKGSAMSIFWRMPHMPSLKAQPDNLTIIWFCLGFDPALYR